MPEWKLASCQNKSQVWLRFIKVDQNKATSIFVPRAQRQTTGNTTNLIWRKSWFESPVKCKIKVLCCNGNTFMLLFEVALKVRRYFSSKLQSPAHTNLETSSTFFFFVGLFQITVITLNTKCVVGQLDYQHQASLDKWWCKISANITLELFRGYSCI